MPEAYFQNYRIESDTLYFLYIGELKNYGLSNFLKEALTRLLKRSVDFIAIVPDIMEQYDHPNLMVINPITKERFYRVKENYSCRVPGPTFMRAVSQSAQVVKLIYRLLAQQEHIYIYMYESYLEMSLDDIDGVSILGPKSGLAHKLNNKIYQYQNLGDTVPLPEFKVCLGAEELKSATDSLWPVWKDGIFVTTAYSAAGISSVLARSWEDVAAKFRSTDCPFLISRYHPHAHDPTVLAVVANANDVYVAGVADQRIEGGNRFTGSTYPSGLSKQIQGELYEATRRVGRKLGQEGYRGIFGCDYVVGGDDDILFVEVNARKQGTTLEFCCTLEQLLPEGAPMLPELEYHAVIDSQFPDSAVELPPGFRQGICWGTYNFKVTEDTCIYGFMPFCGEERQCFIQAGKGKVSRQFVVLEHIGNDFVLGAGSFLGRIVALGKDHQHVHQGLLQGKKMLEGTITDEPVKRRSNDLELLVIDM
jgi:hypothetical protein